MPIWASMPNHVYLASFDLDPLGYTDAKALELDRQILARVKALPGVESATLADFSPLSFTIHSDGVMPEGYIPRPHESIEVDRGIVGPGYLETLRTPLIAGRDFTDADNESRSPWPSSIRPLSNRYWPGQDAIGKRIQIAGRWRTVVGVAANGKYRRLTYDAAPLVLVPLAAALREPADSPCARHWRSDGVRLIH